jgi:hypothetical protein
MVFASEQLLMVCPARLVPVAIIEAGPERVARDLRQWPQKRRRSATVLRRGEPSGEALQSITDSEARLYKKSYGKESKLESVMPLDRSRHFS